MNRGGSRPVLITALTLSGLIAYMLPWVHTPGVSLTLGAYDLAEWSSLTPAIRGETPTLLTSLLLRVPLMCIAVLLALCASLVRDSHGVRWGILGVAFLIAIVQFPPFAFFAGDHHDPNYQQQFALALLTLILAGAALRVKNLVLMRVGGLMAASIAAVTGLLGLLRSYRVMQTYELPVSLGMGGLLMIVALLIGLAVILAGDFNQKIRAAR